MKERLKSSISLTAAAKTLVEKTAEHERAMKDLRPMAKATEEQVTQLKEQVSTMKATEAQLFKAREEELQDFAKKRDAALNRLKEKHKKAEEAFNTCLKELAEESERVTTEYAQLRTALTTREQRLVGELGQLDFFCFHFIFL